MTTTRRPAAPKDLALRGARFWREVVKVYELNVDEIQMLAETCRTLDLTDQLRDLIDAEGLTTKGSQGQTVMHPAVGELRQARTLLAKLVHQLGLPDPTTAGAPPSSNSSRAAKAAEARWRQHEHRKARRHGPAS